MLLGNQSRFGIEIALDSQHSGAWMNGRTCYWIAGQRVGDFDTDDSLRDVLFRWERISCDNNRENESLFLLDTQQLLKVLYCGLYYAECQDKESIQQLSIDQQWARHNINPETQSFQGWIVFMVSSGLVARCLYAPCNDLVVQGFEITIGINEFDEVLNQAVDYLSSIYKDYA